MKVFALLAACIILMSAAAGAVTVTAGGGGGGDAGTIDARLVRLEEGLDALRDVAEKLGTRITELERRTDVHEQEIAEISRTLNVELERIQAEVERLRSDVHSAMVMRIANLLAVAAFAVWMCGFGYVVVRAAALALVLYVAVTCSR